MLRNKRTKVFSETFIMQQIIYVLFEINLLFLIFDWGTGCLMVDFQINLIVI